MKNKKIAAILILTVITFFIVITLTPSEVHISIIHTNDIHSRVIEGKYAGMGLAKTTTLIKEARAKNANTILLDAGDTFHGQSFATIEKGASILALMNAMGYDAMVPGNHDFNYGQAQLLNLINNANFDIISANILKADKQSFIAPYTIIEKQGVKIGIFGLTTPDTIYKTHPNNVKGLEFANPYMVAQKMVKELSPRVDVIIALTHIGLDKSSTYTSDKLAEIVNGIDLIVDGHSHTILPQGKAINNTLIVSTGEHNKNLGVVDIYLVNNKIEKKQAHLITKSQVGDVVPDAEISAKLEEILDKQSSILDEVVCKASISLNGERKSVRVKQTNLGNTIGQAMIAETGADCAIVNAGAIRASIEAGDITKREVINVLPFGNYIITKRMTGSVILAALEHGTKDFPNEAGCYPQVANIEFTINNKKPVGKHLESVKIAGKPIDLGKEYVIVINDFISEGGDDYYMFKALPILNEYCALDEAVLKYLNNK